MVSTARVRCAICQTPPRFPPPLNILNRNPNVKINPEKPEIWFPQTNGVVSWCSAPVQPPQRVTAWRHNLILAACRLRLKSRRFISPFLHTRLRNAVHPIDLDEER